MFPPKTPLTLTALTFTTEDIDQESRRIVILKFEASPFTAPLAEALNVRSALFRGADPKVELDTIVIRLDDRPLQRMTLTSAPDLTAGRLYAAVSVLPKLRAKVKIDREPPVMSATLSVSLQYPEASALLELACGLGLTHYVTFEPEQGDLLTTVADDAPPRRRSRIEAGDVLRPGTHAEH